MGISTSLDANGFWGTDLTRDAAMAENLPSLHQMPLLRDKAC
jgi:hypothetical protein